MTPTIPSELIAKLEKSQPVLRYMIARWKSAGPDMRQTEKAIAVTACRTGRGMTPSECVSLSAVAAVEVYRSCEDKIAEYETLPRFVREARTDREADAFLQLWRSGTVDHDGNLKDPK